MQTEMNGRKAMAAPTPIYRRADGRWDAWWEGLDAGVHAYGETRDQAIIALIQQTGR